MASNMSITSVLSLLLISFLTIITSLPLAASVPIENELGTLPIEARGINTAKLPAKGTMRGVWVWDSVYMWNAAEQSRMLTFLKANGFNRILMQMPFVWNNGIQLINQTAISSLLDNAARNNIVVEALDGAPDMAQPENQQTTAAKVQLLINYNAGRPKGSALLAGIHWDIEIYALAGWSDQATRNGLMRNLVGVLSAAAAAIASAKSGLTLAYDLPFWYHAQNAPGDTCTFAWAGRNQSLDRHILDVVDYAPVMSYRRSATGDNSIVGLAMDAVGYANAVGKRVCPSMETVPLDDTPGVSFYGTSSAAYTMQRSAVVAALQGQASFQGVMTHAYPEIRWLLTGS